MERNIEKFKAIREITVQDVLDWLDGCAVSCLYTETQLDTITDRYIRQGIHYTIFSIKKYGEVYLSNKRWLDNSKSFLDEYSKEKNTYWDTLSNKSIRKCRDKDSMIRMILRVFLPYLHFKIDGRSYDFIHIKKILSKNGNSIYLHNKSKEITSLEKRIYTLEEEIKKCKRKVSFLRDYQSIYMDLHEDGSTR